MASNISEQFGDEETQLRIDIKQFRNPNIVFFHLFFRSFAVVAYLFCGFFSANFIANFLFVIILLSLDFWTVKNVTGRILVGLRWWNQVAENGSSEWLFESKKNFMPHATEKKIFWWSLYIYTVLWVMLLLPAFFRFSFNYLVCVIIAISLNFSNVIGYTKCEKEAQKKVTELASQYGSSLLKSSLMSSAANSIFTSAFSSIFNSKTAPVGGPEH